MSTARPEIDAQHRELIAKINELHRIHQAGATVDDIKAVLRWLGDYARRHFSFEEGLMEKFKCPMRTANCAAHARFLMEYQELLANFTMEQDVDQTAGEIKRKAARWLVAHICQVDRSLREIVQS
jgi:hemerythrin